MPRQITSIRNLQVGDRFRTMNGETTYVMTKRVSRHRGRIAKSEVSHKYFGFRRESLPVYLLEKAQPMPPETDFATLAVQQVVVDERKPVQGDSIFRNIGMGEFFEWNNFVFIKSGYDRGMIMSARTNVNRKGETVQFQPMSLVMRLHNVQITIKD